MNVTLEDLLASRDARCLRETELLRQFPSRTLVCLTVMMPGAEKRNGMSLRVAAAGVEAVRSRLQPSFEELRDLETGYEAFFTVDAPVPEVKRRCCRIEDAHPLGRLMDLDVFEAAPAPRPVSREAVGLSPRRCLLCENEARYCMRNHTHTTAQLLDRIREMTEAYAKV